MDLGERRPFGHLVDGDDPCCELAQPPPGQAADEVLGEDGQTLLCLVATGQTDAE